MNQKGDNAMKKFACFMLTVFGTILMAASVASAVKTLDKISEKGEFIVGLREGSIPFGFYDKKGNWGGFSADIAKEIHKAIEHKLGKEVKLTFKPVNAKTRIPLVANGTIDIVCGSSTHTIARDDVIDFSITYFLTGTRLLVPKGSPIKDFEDLAGKRIGAARGTANEKAIRAANESGIISPPVKILIYEEHPKGFLAMRQGKVDAYCTDEILLAGLKMTATDPEKWDLVGRLFTFEPYGFIVRENDSDFRDLVNFTIIDLVKTKKFYEIYDTWFGPNGKIPMPISKEYDLLLNLQCWP
jgi:polar amino acid transport system substrate-binding protein/glutamate/aspartate transport system substrate-binding protein